MSDQNSRAPRCTKHLPLPAPLEDCRNCQRRVRVRAGAEEYKGEGSQKMRCTVCGEPGHNRRWHGIDDAFVGATASERMKIYRQRLKARDAVGEGRP